MVQLFHSSPEIEDDADPERSATAQTSSPYASSHHQSEFERFSRFIERKGLKSTRQREVILQTFLEADKHIDVEDLTRRVRARNPAIGHATVYRTMKLLTECGLAHESHFGDGMARYEHASHKHHHDHMICLRCQDIIEFENPAIEALQEAAAAAQGFTILSHKLEIYGHCARCTTELSRGGTGGDERR